MLLERVGALLVLGMFAGSAAADQESGRPPVPVAPEPGSVGPRGDPLRPPPTVLPPAPVSASSDPAVEQAYERAMGIEGDPAAPPEVRADAWCRLAGFPPPNPYASGAAEACRAWSEYVARRAAGIVAMRYAYERMRGLLSLARMTKDERLRAVDGFLSEHAALVDLPPVRVAAELRVSLDEAEDEAAARELVPPTLGGLDDEAAGELAFSFDVGPMLLLHGISESMAGTVGVVAGGLSPLASEPGGATRKYGLAVASTVSEYPLESSVELTYRSGTYAAGRRDGDDGRWQGLGVGGSLGFTLLSLPSLERYSFSLLNLSLGVAAEGVAGSPPTPDSLPFYGTTQAFAANTSYFACAFALRVAWREPLSHAELFPAYVEALLGLDVREHCP